MQHLEQRRDLALGVAATDTDAVILATIARALDDERSSELHWHYTAPYHDSASWVDGAVESFATISRAGSLVAESKGGRGFRDLPPQAVDREALPIGRMQALIAHSRTLSPDPEGITVWNLIPLQIYDPGSWRTFLEALTAHELPFPWCERVRLVARLPDARESPSPAPLARRLVLVQVDFSTPALEASLVEDARNSRRPLEERMQALLMSASSDYAHSRLTDALTKYSVLLQHYEALGNATMCAIVLNGLGETHLRNGDPKQAEAHFVTAMTAGGAAKPPAVSVVLNASLNLANLCREQQRWPEAAANYRAVETLAGITQSEVTAIEAAEARAFCESQGGDPLGATDTWLAAAELATQYDRGPAFDAIVERLQRHLTQHSAALTDASRRSRWLSIQNRRSELTR